LVNPPEPVIAWETVVSKPLVSNVPPPAFRAMARVLARLKFAPSRSVPPLKVSPPLAAPRLASAETPSVPPLIAHGVAAAVVPVSVQVLAPVFSYAPKPRYCAAGPICETLKLPLPAPTSASVSAALKGARSR
jgi:hypothetical protein